MTDEEIVKMVYPNANVHQRYDRIYRENEILIMRFTDSGMGKIIGKSTRNELDAWCEAKEVVFGGSYGEYVLKYLLS